jgi:hypothetical protein
VGLVFVRRTTQNRLLTIFGILLLAGFLHGNVAIQVLHDVSQFHSPLSEQNPEENSEGGSPGHGDGAEITAPCPVCSSVLARALPSEIEVAIPTLAVPAVDPRPVSGSHWASPCFIPFEARAPPPLS